MVRDVLRPEGDRVLIAGGEPDEPATDLVRLLESQGCEVTLAPGDIVAGGATAEPYLVAILRRRPGELFASADLYRLRAAAPTLRIAVVGRAGSVAGAVAAMRAQAFDYLEDPVAPDAVAALLRRARETPDPRQTAQLETLEALTPGLVHELRNPLSGILAGSQMLARLVAGQGVACEYAEIIRDEAQHLQRFLARLAEFGRLGRGGLRVADTVDLPGLVRGLLDTVRATCDARGILIVSAFAPRAPIPRGDPGRLGLACSEIIQNALDAMPEGGTLTVTTGPAAACGPVETGTRTASASDAWVEVAFSDTGAGMNEEVRRRACEPFFSTRPRALGVGLSLAQAVARAHGGVVRVGQTAHGGGHVILRLPAEPGESSGSRRSVSASTRHAE